MSLSIMQRNSYKLQNLQQVTKMIKIYPLPLVVDVISEWPLSYKLTVTGYMEFQSVRNIIY